MADYRESAIPRIDLGDFAVADGSGRREIGRLVDLACRNTGFLVIANHGVSADIVDAAWLAARNFFDRPLERKLEVRPPRHDDPRGYFPLEFEALTRSRGVETAPDPKESFSCGPLTRPANRTSTEDFDFFYGPNRWPATPVHFKDAWTAYYRAMEILGARIMELFAVALDLPGDYFAAFHDAHVSALRGLNYPESPAPDTPRQQRAGAHSDYGSVTILKPDPAVGGLELRLPSGEWLEAPEIGNEFLVNIGDLLARWTNDRWVSTLHRVTTPDSIPGNRVPRRQSIAYFQNPNPDARIAALPGCVPTGELPGYEPVQAGPYLRGQFLSAV